MKTTHLLAALVAAATLPLTAIPAEKAGQTETTDQKQDQSSETTGMKGKMMSVNEKEGMGMCRMMMSMNKETGHDGAQSHHH